MSLTCLPRSVSPYLRVLEPCFHHRHQLVFSWLLVWRLVYGERANLKALARYGPQHLADQHYRCLLCAAYWCTKTLLWWFAEQALQALPPPGGGILYVVGESMLTGKRGSKHPVAQKTRLSQYHSYVFGFRIVLLMAQWDVYRIPVDVALIRRTDDTDDHTENALFRLMLQEFRCPMWCQQVVVTADAAYASRANLATIQALGYWYTMALPRAWEFAHGKAVKDLVMHLPRGKCPQIRMPTVNTPRRRTI
jgi:hypothetical protein